MDDSFPVRLGVNAVVESDDRLLVVTFDDETGVHYNLPGGGVRAGERISDALCREVREETTADVAAGELVFVHEYYPPDHNERYGSTHKLTLFFDCKLVAGTTPELPETPDPNQVDVEWLSLGAIAEEPLLPDLGEKWETIAAGTPTHRYSSDC